MGGIVAVPSFSAGASCTKPQPEWFVNQGYSLPFAKERRARSAMATPVSEQVAPERLVRTSHNTPLQSPTTSEQQVKRDQRIKDWVTQSLESIGGSKEEIPLKPIQNRDKLKPTKLTRSASHRNNVRHVMRGVESSAG
eukprot:308859-Hanusia_phi.AAC.2